MREVPENIANSIKISVVDLLKPKDEVKTAEVTVECKEKKIKKKSKQFSRDNIALFAAEFVGTALLIFLGCMGCISGVGEPTTTHHVGSLSFGLVVMLIIQIFGHISGAHLNPAVTIATVYLGYLKPSLALVYFLAEFSGAIAGFGLLKVLIPSEFTETEIYDEETNLTVHKVGLCSTVPYKTTTVIQALLIETILTTVLILVCCAVWDRRNADKPDSTPLRFGFIIAVIGMVAGPFTGASMNTARSIGPAIFNSDWEAHWVYWVGPTLGSIIGAGLYKTIFWPPKIKDDLVEDETKEAIEQVTVTT